MRDQALHVTCHKHAALGLFLPRSPVAVTEWVESRGDMGGSLVMCSCCSPSAQQTSASDGPHWTSHPRSADVVVFEELA
uniref:Uncharacterized protein n=1 Tax=Knipowitschia caucasica TaxID=637954 RepID=A0AAV2MEJ7_KNICA